MRILLVAVVILIVAVVVAARSPLAVLDAITPHEGYVRKSDLAYGPLTRQQLDVYVPSDSAHGAPRPVIVFFYGGGWETGERADYRFVAQALASQGFVTVLPDYRIYPEARFPDFVTDGAAALKWTKDHATEFGGDPEQLFVAGFSAGAHIAAMLTLDRQYLRTVGMSPDQLRGMVGLAGPYDFLPLQSETLKEIFGPEAQRWKSQPINFVDGSNPRLLLIAGTDDTTVSPGNTERLAAKVHAKGGPVTVKKFDGFTHAGLILRFATLFRGNGEVVNTVTNFVRDSSSANRSATAKIPSVR